MTRKKQPGTGCFFQKYTENCTVLADTGIWQKIYPRRMKYKITYPQFLISHEFFVD